MKQAKASGTRFEYRVMHYFAKRGWEVIRSSGSHTSADLVCFKENIKPVWVQCKATERLNLSPKEKYELLYAQNYYNVISLAIFRMTAKPWSLRFAEFLADGTVKEIEEPSWLKI